MGQARDQTAAFVAAIRSYDWEAAKRLARSQQEEEGLRPESGQQSSDGRSV